MAKIKLNGDTSGYIEISAPAVSGNNTLELGPGTKILTNLDNTFTGVSTFTSGLHITSGGFILNQQRSDTHTSLIIDKPDAGTGTLKFFNNGSASAYIQHTGAEHLHYYLPSGSGYHALYTNGTERLRITSDGKMGLGTQTPDATLKVNVASGNNGVVVQNTSTANIALFGARNGDATVQIGQWGSTASGSTFGLSNADLSFIYTTSYSTTHPSALALGTVSNKPIVFATNNTERLRITSGGDLAVGATGDVYGPARLNIRPDNRNTQFSASDGNTWHDIVVKQNDTNASGGNAVGLAFEISTSGWHANAGTGIAAIKDSNSTDFGSHLAFITRPHAAVAEERLRITSDGDVGIGDNAPNSNYGTNLSVHSTATDGARLKLSDGTSGKGNTDGFDLISTGGVAYMLNRENADMSFSTNNTEGMRLYANRKLHLGNSHIDSNNLTRLHVGWNTGGTVAGESIIAGTLGNDTTAVSALLTLKNAGNRGAQGASGGSSLAKFEFNNGTAFEIDRYGRRTLPYQPGCKLTIDTNSQGGGNNAQTGRTILPFNSTGFGYNTGNHYNLTTHTFTAPLAGKYLVILSVNVIGDNIAYIYKNGSIHSAGEFRSNPNGTWEHMEISTVVECSANDTIQPYSQMTGSGRKFNGGNQPGSYWDTFTIYYLG